MVLPGAVMLRIVGFQRHIQRTGLLARYAGVADRPWRSEVEAELNGGAGGCGAGGVVVACVAGFL